ncbi:MAG: flotillin family protein [Bacteroidota bacterium]|nr:flotillin family protein [Bacteroidota bacterium]
MSELLSNITFVSVAIIVGIFFGIIIILSKWYHKATQGVALVRTGVGGTKVSFSGIIVIPVLHRLEVMDISLKTINISRIGKDGLICQDNLRADIKVAFFVRVNKTKEDVVAVAQTIGCVRASDQDALIQLFDAKFSEALKTVGKQFDFVELYNSRVEFKQQILQIIGTDLNGFVLDDAAIDYLEQTLLEFMNIQNILDAEGIKKITDLTSKQKVQANLIIRDTEKTIKKQDVEAREAILELERQLSETEEKQKREVASIVAREEAEICKVQEEERQKSQKARIAADEEIDVAQQNKERQVIVAEKNKERTEAIEIERVEKDRALESVERERIVTLAEIEKEKAIEVEKKNIQDVIRERVTIEKSVVEEEEKIKDTRAFAEAKRQKIVAITKAEELAEESLVQEIKAAESATNASEFKAKQLLIEAEAEQASAIQKGEAIKILAQATIVRNAAPGIAEAQITEAKAVAREKEGAVEAHIIYQKLSAEAKGIDEKAIAMGKLDALSKDHEEFRLTLEKEKEVQLAEINIQAEIAHAQAAVLSEALKNAKIDIVGGDAVFFDKIVGAISNGKSVDRFVNNSDVLTNVKDQLLEKNGIPLKDNIKNLIQEFGVSSEDIKNLTISTLLFQLMGNAGSDKRKETITKLIDAVKNAGLADKSVGSLLK